MSMWSELGPLGLGMVVFLYMIKLYFVNKSIKKNEERIRARPYVSMRQRKIDAKMERRQNSRF